MYLLLEEGFNELLILTLTMKWGAGLYINRPAWESSPQYSNFAYLWMSLSI